MATVLLAWELGAGCGHLARLSPIARGLLERGHRVFVAIRERERATSVLPEGLAGVFQSPSAKRGAAWDNRPPLTFAHVLHGVGFDRVPDLYERCGAWREIYDRVRPDVVVFDHSPTALLAAGALPLGRVLVGSGFFCPPDRSPLPNLRPWVHADPRTLLADELAVLGRMNAVLARYAAPPLERVTQLYADADETCLTTFRELDHYPDRVCGNYFGAWTKVPGKAPRWPDVPGRRIFAYLKPSTGLARLLALLREAGQATVISCDRIGHDVQARFAAPHICFENERLDMELVARDCDFGVLNGNHGTTIALLMAGKPSFHVPITLEQALFADAVRRTGAGLAASGAREEEIAARFGQMLVEDKCSNAARRFQARYKNEDFGRQQQRLVDRIARLASR